MVPRLVGVLALAAVLVALAGCDEDSPVAGSRERALERAAMAAGDACHRDAAGAVPNATIVHDCGRGIAAARGIEANQRKAFMSQNVLDGTSEILALELFTRGIAEVRLKHIAAAQADLRESRTRAEGIVARKTLSAESLAQLDALLQDVAAMKVPR